MCYKVIKDGTFIGVGTAGDLRRYQEKHGLLLICGIDKAEYIIIDDAMYHDSWFCPVKTDKYEYIDAEVTKIDEDEYNSLAEAIELGEEILSETESDSDESEGTINGEDGVQDAIDAVVNAKYSERLAALEDFCEKVKTLMGIE